MTMWPPNTPVIVAATGESGMIVSVLGVVGDAVVYNVLVGRKVRRHPDNELEAVDLGAEPETPVVGMDAVRRLLTLLKVSFQLQGQLASLDGTRTQFFAYQYKPLLKLERSQLDRVLVADEVGLGKTIEAGFVILETIARQPFADVVVVCPPMLREKWKRELRNRFGLDFTVLRSREAADRIARGLRQPEDPPLRAIVAYETIRSQTFRDALDEETTQRHIDLLIADEAHRARNPRALQSRALEALCDRTYTRQVVFLTATPMQTRQEDLFQLLWMLLPSEFPDWQAFADRMAANRVVVAAERAVSGESRQSLREAADALEHCDDDLISKNPFHAQAIMEVRNLITLLDEPASANPEALRAQHTAQIEARVRAQEALFQVNLLSPVLTRTRRRDVHDGIAMREARSVDARLTDYEQWAYDLVSQAIFDEYKRRHGDDVARFVLKGFQARLASSLPAAIADYRQRLGVTGVTEEEDSTDGADEAELDQVILPDEPGFPLLARAVRQVDVERLRSDDSKWRLLHQALRQHLDLKAAADEPRKLILFSYYKRSLDLIGAHLQREGIRFERIDGDVPTDIDPARDERQQRIQRFQTDPEIRVMLASQVGCEGLDFQFCDTIINWDLPWNPMMVEQRIGRIDRIGQKAKRIFILNIACQGTVEWEILQRLYMRLDLFRASIGDLEEVLGEVEATLQNGLFDPELTPKQREVLIAQTAQACEVRKQQLEDLRKVSEQLIGQDRFLTDEVEHLRQAGRYLSHEDLERFIRERVQAIDPRSSVAGPANDGTFTLQIETVLLQHLSHSGASQRSREWARVFSHIRAGRYRFALQAGKAPMDVDLLSAAHPLVRALLPTDTNAVDDLRKAFATRVCSDAVPAGRWTILVTRLDFLAEQRTSGLLCAICNIATGEVHTDTRADALLTAVLNSPPAHVMLDPKEPEFLRAEQRAIEAMTLRVAKLKQTRIDHATRTAARKRAVCERHYGHLLGRLKQQIDGHQAKADPGEAESFFMRMQRSKVTRFERERDTELDLIDRVKKESIAQTDVFIGLLEVENP
jgi:superfamily II DNA or RNA helicase